MLGYYVPTIIASLRLFQIVHELLHLRNINGRPTMNPLKCAIIVNSGRDSPSQVNHGATEADSEKKAKSAVVFACIVAQETLYVSKRTGAKYVWQNLFFHANVVSVQCRCPCQQIY